MTLIADQLLFGNRLAPITSRIGLLKVDKSTLAAEIQRRFESVEGRAWNPKPTEMFDGLEAILRRLAPLRKSSTRFAIVPTNSDWTAIFESSLSGTDATLPDVISDTLKCEKLMVAFCAGKDEVDVGGCSMPGRVFSYSKRPGLGVGEAASRDVWAILESGWEFGQSGDPLPGESTASYGMRRIRDRLPIEQVKALCNLVGASPFEVGFYDVPRRSATVISLNIQPRLDDPELSIEQAQRWNAR